MVWVAICLASFLVAGRAAAATYYISSNTGSDANTSAQAQSKSTPWAHLPCMANATSNAAAYTPVPGDTFVLKGGESWPNASFPCTWRWSGTRRSKITMGGTDQTWYTGGSWTRPIWTAGNSPVQGPKNIMWYDSLVNAIHDVTVSSIEFTGFHWDGDYPFASCSIIQVAGSTYITLDNLYIHAWTHTGTFDPCTIILGSSNSPFSEGSVLRNSFVDGSDSTNGGDSMSIYMFPNYVNNVLQYFTSMAMPKGNSTITGNTVSHCIHSIDVRAHPNMFESLGGNPGGYTMIVANNVFHDGADTCEQGLIGNPGETAYLWNNVWYNNLGNVPALTQNNNTGAGVAAYFWNNTIVAPQSGPHFGGISEPCLLARAGFTYSVVEFRNNHCISNNSLTVSADVAATTLTITPNVKQSLSVANGQGYTAAQTYAYSPTDSGDATVGTGVDLTSKCTGAFVSLCSDTTYGQGFNATTKTVTGPARRPYIRPSGAAWNVGAYQAGGNSDLRNPFPPNGLVVQ